MSWGESKEEGRRDPALLGAEVGSVLGRRAKHREAKTMCQGHWHVQGVPWWWQDGEGTQWWEGLSGELSPWALWAHRNEDKQVLGQSHLAEATARVSFHFCDPPHSTLHRTTFLPENVGYIQLTLWSMLYSRGLSTGCAYERDTWGLRVKSVLGDPLCSVLMGWEMAVSCSLSGPLLFTEKGQWLHWATPQAFSRPLRFCL